MINKIIESTIDQFAIDLRDEFPDMKGFSHRNLFYISQWVQFYTGKSLLVQQPVALIKKLAGQVPWGLTC